MDISCRTKQSFGITMMAGRLSRRKKGRDQGKTAIREINEA